MIRTCRQLLIWFALLLAGSAAAHAQVLTLYAITGSNGTSPIETPTGGLYGLGQIASGESRTYIFRVRTDASVRLSILTVTGAGFKIVDTSSPGITIAPAAPLDIRVQFTANTPGTFPATLRINDLLTDLQVTVVPSASVSAASPCSIPDGVTINFGRTQQNTQVTCTISLQNPFSQTLTISPVSVGGTGFSTSAGVSVTIPANGTASFTITFLPPTASALSGTLTLGVRSYALQGVGFLPPMPTPIFTFDSTSISSGQQRTLTVSLPSPAPTTASGNITFTFASDAAGIPDDAAIQFVATSKRVVSFSVKAGDTAVLLNSQPNAVFSTGTTRGRITFSIDANPYGFTRDPAVLLVNASPITFTATGATRRGNDLDVTIAGFDNTYTAGSMLFTFFDRNGAQLGAAIPANFIPDFTAFYAGKTAGSAFNIRVTFPTSGNASLVGGVEATMSNSIGVTKTDRLSFP
jgi:hypothetical protein